MKKAIYIFNNWKLNGIILLIVLFSQGCRKQWLEAKVDKRQAVPSSVEDFQALLDNFNNFNNLPLAIAEIASDGHYYTEAFFDILKSSNPTLSNAYTWSETVPYETISLYESQMYLMYHRILDANIIIEESGKYVGENKEEIEHVRAQALFHRARFHFEMAQVFIPPYNSATADTDLGLPLQLSTDVTEQYKRSSVAETYQQIIADLMKAKDALPNTPQFISRASKPAVLALLARVYLAMNDYPNAHKYADAYLDIRNELLDYHEIATNNSIGVNKEVIFISLFLYGSVLTNSCLIDQDLYDSYATDDLRKTLFFDVQAEGIVFKGTYCNDLVNETFIGLATDEIYLIRAECLARAGDLTGAMKDLNDLLKARWARNIDGTTKYTDQVASDETDALTKIFTERKKELILRNIRWTDLRRLNFDDRFKVVLSRTIGVDTYTLDPGSYQYTFPIPYQVIQKSGIPQNSGW